MKFSLTIHDLTDVQVTNILYRFAGTTALVKDKVESTVTVDPAPAPAIPNEGGHLLPKAAEEELSRVVNTTLAAADPAPTTGNDAEFDVNGFPWDERIHAGSKNKNADGSWRYKRGVEKDLIAEVEAELKPVPSDTPTPEEIAQKTMLAEATTPTEDANGIPPMFQRMPVDNAAPAPAPAEAPAPAPAPAEEGRDFGAMMKIVSAKIKAQELDAASISATCAMFGIGNFQEVAQNPTLAGPIIDYLNSLS